MSTRLLAAVVLAVSFQAPVLLADFLEVRHRGPIRGEPVSSAARLDIVDRRTALDLLDDGNQVNGYYHVRATDGTTGWIYRTLVRRFRGDGPGVAAAVPDVTELPNFEPSWPESGVPEWILRSKHLLYGMPRLTASTNFTVEQKEVPGVSILVREGFIVGHYDRFKVPLWVSVRWTREDFQRSDTEPSFPRPFEPDEELPSYARAGSSYNGTVTGFDRGHMARHKDNAAYGHDNSDAGCLMSNIAPQLARLNRNAWLGIEDEHRKAVTDQGIDALWVISGTVFEQGEPQELIANEVGVPQATYKVVAWFSEDGELQMRGFVLRQTDTVDDPERYLRSVDEIEELTGLDFFPDLADPVEDQLEAIQSSTIW